jgi:L-fuculose-phosphate aldolase
MPGQLLDDSKRNVSELGRKMVEMGLTEGTGGNISEQGEDELIAVSPTRIAYDDITPEDVPIVNLEGEQVDGDTIPSSETPMHTQIYRARDDVGGVVHTHSPYASAFATLGEPIPPSHYLLAYIGEKVPVAGFDQPGTEGLGKLAVEALRDDYDACLLQHHGVMTVGETAADALENALMVEFCARVHYLAESIGDPLILEGDDLEGLIQGFDEYRSLDV